MATKQEIDAIYQENLGRAPDPGAYETYGGDMSAEAVTNEVLSSPEYKSVQAGVSFSTQTLEDGTVVNVYGTKDNPGFNQDDPFNFSNKEGDVFAVPEGTAVASGKNYKLVKTVNGLDYYVNEGSGGDGVFGTLADLTGIGEIKDIGDAASKAIPNELKSGIVPIPLIADPFGITQGFWGKEYAGEGVSSISDVTGLKPEEIQMAQDIGVDVAALTAAALGAPYIGAGFKSVKDASKTSEGRQSTEDLLKDVTINYAIAGAIDLMTPAAVTPNTTPAAAPSAPAGEFDYTSGLYGGESGVGAGLGYPTVLDSFSSGMDAGLFTAPASTTTAGAATAGETSDMAALINAVSGGGKEAAGMDWKSIAAIGSLALGGIGLGIQGYSVLTQPSQEELLKQKQKLDQESQAKDFEYQKQLLQMKLDAEMQMQEEALAPLPSSPAPSTYSGGVKSPSTYKPYGVY